MSTAVFRRYSIDARPAPDVAPLPPRFRVRVKRRRLIGLVLKELVEFRLNLRVALDRPCVYGVFGRPLGGLTPREELCVGCLRCTVQYPDVVQIQPNPKRRRLGDSYLRPEHVDTILYEARTGRVPVRGAGYRGPFGGAGWDGMWLDMSEIVRPTRDGIHGRESISTAVDIGEKPSSLLGASSCVLSLPLPFLLDVPPDRAQNGRVLQVLVESARQLGILAIVPAGEVARLTSPGRHIVPLVAADGGLPEPLPQPPAMLELDGWNSDHFAELGRRLPETVLCVRVAADADVVELAREGARVIHLVADYHGRAGDSFIRDLAQQAHKRLVEAGLREEVTLIGSGGIALVEHVAKAIACGLDAVALDLPVWTALQGEPIGEWVDRRSALVNFPRFGVDWGVQRIKNLAASWHNQLLEVLGAMGMRDVRRLRGELGRCMFQHELESEAFGGIGGYVARA